MAITGIKMKIKLSGALLCIGFALSAGANASIVIGCNVTNMFDEAMIQFSGATQHPGITEFTSNRESASPTQAMMAGVLGIDGMLSVDVHISGNGNEYQLNVPMSYAIKGNRIEAVLGQNVERLSDWDEFVQQFGSFPKVRCTAAN